MGNNQSNVPKFGSVYSTESARPGYYFGKKQAIYKGTLMDILPDENSFKKLGYSYAKSNKRVFYKGVPIPGANPITFDTVTRNKVKGLIKNSEKLEKLNSVLGTDFKGNSRNIYYRGNLVYTEHPPTV
jgi:hypothetical protein